MYYYKKKTFIPYSKPNSQRTVPIQPFNLSMKQLRNKRSHKSRIKPFISSVRDIPPKTVRRYNIRVPNYVFPCLVLKLWVDCLLSITKW